MLYDENPSCIFTEKFRTKKKSTKKNSSKKCFSPLPIEKSKNLIFENWTWKNFFYPVHTFVLRRTTILRPILGYVELLLILSPIGYFLNATYFCDIKYVSHM